MIKVLQISFNGEGEDNVETLVRLGLFIFFRKLL